MGQKCLKTVYFSQSDNLKVMPCFEEYQDISDSEEWKSED